MHDYFNLLVLPGLIALTLMSLLVNVNYSFLLAAIMWIYVAIDGLWIYLMPHIVGSPKVLIGHHIATLLVVGHVLTFPAHLKYTSWLTLVEINTFFLVLKRHLESPLLSKLNAMAFNVTWLLIRAIWFPIAAGYFLFFAGDWGSLARHVVVGSCIGGLGLLQLAWTRNALKGMIEKAKAEKEDGGGGASSGKKGFL